QTVKQLAVERRRQQIAEMRLQGWSQQAIADRLDITQATVSNDLKSIRQQWRERMIADFNDLQAEELQRVERIEREAWAGWERSQKPAESAVIEADPKKARRKTVKNQHGDPRFLSIVSSCIQSRRAILGLDAPKKVAPTDVEGRTLTLADLLG